MFEKSIQYDRTTKDYRMELDGRLIGYARNHHEAEITLNQVVYEMLIHGDCATATELDGDCPDCEPVLLDASWSTAPVASTDELCACGGVATLVVRSCEAHICGLCFINDYENDVNGSLAWTVEPLCSDNPPHGRPGHDEDGVPHALLIDIARTLDMALGRTHGNASIVHELRRVRAEVQGILGNYHAV